MNDECVIELADARKTFRDFWLRPTVNAVDGLSLSVRRGEVFGLLGPNGSGKSTTIKMILGLLAPSGGKVSLFGLSPRSVEARRRLGYLPELSYLHPFLTAKETLRYYAGLCGLGRGEAKERTRQLLEMVGLSDVASRPVGGFSKGMSRRVALAASLVGRPELLVLDEPTSGLDPIMSEIISQLILDLKQKLGVTSIVITHDMKSAFEISDNLAMLYEGKVQLAAPKEEFKRTQNPYVKQFIEGSANGPIQMKISN